MTRFFVRHPVTTWMIFTAFVVLGIYALPKLKIEAMPEVDLPSLTIATQWTGASPKAIQRSITLPIEEAVRNVHGVEKVESTSRPGRSFVQVSFRRKVDIDFARLELNEQLGSVRRELPLNAGEPMVFAYVPEEFDTEDFFTFSIESQLSPNALRDEAEKWIVPQMLAVEGVADARVEGGARPLVKVTLDRKRLELYGIGADEVFAALDRMDEFIGAGVVREEGIEKLLAVREPVTLEKLQQAIVARRGERTYRLGMLGKVEADFEDPEQFVRANGDNVVRVAVDKRSGANTVAVSRALRDALPRVEANLPFQATFHVDDDQGEELRDKLVELVYRSLAILGILFLLLVVVLRQVRLTAIVIGSIIFAVVISLSLFYFFKISVNFITISGLTVCFGLLLDNSILVMDSIHRRLKALDRAQEAGLSRAAKLKVASRTVVAGTFDVAFPILATTLTTVVAFVSFIFLSGRLALYYVPLAVSVTTAMAGSMFVAFGWLPVVLNQSWTASLVRHTEDGARDVTDDEEIETFVRDRADLDTAPPFIERVFIGAQRIWWLLLPPVAAAMIWGGFVYDRKVNKGGFFRMPDMQELFLYLELPAGTDLKVTSETLARFEQSLLPVPEGARMLATTYDNRATIRVKFDDDLLKTEIPMKFRQNLVLEADETGGSTVYIRGFADQPYLRGNFSGSALNSGIKLTGYNSRRLGEIADGALARMARNRRARNARVTSGERFDRSFLEESIITINRDKLVEHDLSVLEVVGYLRRLLGVDTPWSMLIDGEEERVQLGFQDAETIQFSDVAGRVLITQSGQKVRLGDLVSLTTQPVKGAVVRENQRYTVYLNWEYVGTDKMRRAYIQQTLDALDLPYGYAAEEATQEELSDDEGRELNRTAILAVVFIFMVMAALFESTSLPILVLTSIPLALFGVVIIFWLTRETFDSSARIGLILLFGIVVNNAILLASRFRTEASLILKEKLGGNPEEEAALFPGMRKQLGGTDLRVLDRGERAYLLRRAVARATRIRLRSIFLTSATTVVGLAPLLIQFKENEGQDIWENLALSSIGGLVSSTILILVVIPPLYYACIRFNWGVRALFGWLGRKLRRGKRAAEPVSAPAGS